MNLANLPLAEREAIEADKQAWFRAYKMLTTMTDAQIKFELSKLGENEKEDMRRRLNQMYGKYKREN
jgi:hypothetical protein